MPTEVENTDIVVPEENINKNEEIVIFEVSENSIKDKIYFIRSQQVMLDGDLAEIYGYEVKNLNRQVKRNIARFPEDFMFQLTDDELSDLRCQNVTANISLKSRTLPYVFTEKGIYMLPSVLKSNLAAKQNVALVRIFTRMKDYIIETQPLLERRSDIQQTLQITQNAQEINNIKSEINFINEKVSDIVEKVDAMVKQSYLADMMNGFIGNQNLRHNSCCT